MGTTRNSRLGGVALAAAGVIALSGVTYRYALHPDVSPKNFGVVEPGRLYRSGGLTPAAMEKVITERGIRTIVDLGAFDKDPVGERLAHRTALAMGVERRVFRLEGDGTGNPNAYVEALRIITDPAKQPVLVHCSAGAQRTSGCIVLYRQLVQGWSRERAMPEAYAHDHDPSDNPRLSPFLDRHQADIERAFRAGGDALIPGVPRAEVRSPAAGPEAR
jgi:protein tyrosine/serine phosphatase